MITAPDPTKVTEATPVLQQLMSRLVARPYYLATEPYAVPPEVYSRAYSEMTDVLQERGWHEPPLCKAIGRENFLLMGVPIVCMDS